MRRTLKQERAAYHRGTAYRVVIALACLAGVAVAVWFFIMKK